MLKVNATIERLSGELGRSPSPQQLAGDLNLPADEVLEAIAADTAYDPLPSIAGAELGSKSHASIGPALKPLPERERLVLHLRFVEDQLESGVRLAEDLGDVWPSRLIRRAARS